MQSNIVSNQQTVNKLDDEKLVSALFSTDAKFLQNENEQNKKFRLAYNNIAKYGDLKEIAKRDSIINAGLDSKNQQIFFIIASRQPENKELFEQFKQQFIVMVDEKINNCFRLVYFNSGQVSNAQITQFLTFYKTLPLKYYQKLVRLYIIHGNMLFSSWLMFQKSVQLTVLKKKFSHISRLSELYSEGFIGKFQLVLLPTIVKENDSSYQVFFLLILIVLTFYQVKQLRDNVLSDEPSLMKEEKKKETLQKVLGLNLNEYELNRHGIPIILDVLISAFYNKPEFLGIEGIFRRNASYKKLFELELMLKKKQIIQNHNSKYNRNYQSILQQTSNDDTITLAGMIKKILDSLAIPLIPYSFYQTIVDDMKTQDPIKQIVLLKKNLYSLPPLNRRMLTVLIKFLGHVIESKATNLMNSYNISVVFGCCFLRPEVLNNDIMAETKRTQLVIKTIQMMIDNCYEIFPNETYEQYLTMNNNIANRRNSLSSESQIQEPAQFDFKARTSTYQISQR